MSLSKLKPRFSMPFRAAALWVILAFVSSLMTPVPGYAQVGMILGLPPPGAMITPSPAFTPAVLKGIKVYVNNPFKFDFVVDPGEAGLKGEAMEVETRKLIKYFLAALTTPEENIWVNLSPYEQDRIVPDEFGQTEMGRDLLAQDYLLKQLTASMIYPENELGKKFWEKIRQKAYEQYGTTEIPMNTFNKVWIVPEKAVIYANGNVAFVKESRLKVMLESDYLAREHQSTGAPEHQGKSLTGALVTGDLVANQILRELVLPEIEREVNEGQQFAQLRQIYNSFLLAVWFKKTLKKSLLGQVYVDQKKTGGINVDDPAVKQKIYDQYVEAYKKGVYDYIREDTDPGTQQPVPRKYFSGGVGLTAEKVTFSEDLAMTSLDERPLQVANVDLDGDSERPMDQVMAEGRMAQNIEDFKRGLTLRQDFVERLKWVVSHLLVGYEDRYDEIDVLEPRFGRRQFFRYAEGKDLVQSDEMWKLIWRSRMELFAIFDSSPADSQVEDMALDFARRLDRVAGRPVYESVVSEIADAYWEELFRDTGINELEHIVRYGFLFNGAGHKIFVSNGRYPAEFRKQLRVNNNYPISKEIRLIWNVPSIAVYTGGGASFYDRQARVVPFTGAYQLPDNYLGSLSNNVLRGFFKDLETGLNGVSRLARLSVKYLDVKATLSVNLERFERGELSDEKFERVRALLNVLNGPTSGLMRVDSQPSHSDRPLQVAEVEVVAEDSGERYGRGNEGEEGGGQEDSATAEIVFLKGYRGSEYPNLRFFENAFMRDADVILDELVNAGYLTEEELKLGKTGRDIIKTWLSRVFDNAVDSFRLKWIQFLPKAELEVKIFVEDAQLYYRINDNGLGFHPTILKKIRQRELTTKIGMKLMRGGRGYALYDSTQLFAELGWELAVENRMDGEGASLTLAIPLTDQKTKVQRKNDPANNRLDSDGAMVSQVIIDSNGFLKGRIYASDFIRNERENRKATIAVDLDKTIAFYVRDNKQFILRNGIYDQLKQLQDSGLRLVMWTAASQSRARRFFKQHPDFLKLFDLKIASENWSRIEGDPEGELREGYRSAGLTGPELDAVVEAQIESVFEKDITLLNYTLLVDDAPLGNIKSFVRHHPWKGEFRVYSVSMFTGVESDTEPIEQLAGNVTKIIKGGGRIQKGDLKFFVAGDVAMTGKDEHWKHGGISLKTKTMSFQLEGAAAGVNFPSFDLSCMNGDDKLTCDPKILAQYEQFKEGFSGFQEIRIKMTELPVGGLPKFLGVAQSKPESDKLSRL